MGLLPTGTGMTPFGDLVRCLPGDETLGFLPWVVRPFWSECFGMAGRGLNDGRVPEGVSGDKGSRLSCEGNMPGGTH